MVNIATTDESTPAILPLVSDSGNEQLLTEWIRDQNEYRLVDSKGELSKREFDVCIVDTGAFRTHIDELQAVKESANLVPIPVLLLVSERDPDLLKTKRSGTGCDVFANVIDEIVTLPIQQSELHWRLNTLLRLRRQYESLFNSIRDAILVADTDRRISNCNRAFTELLGYELAEIEGEHTRYVYESGEEFEAMGEAIEKHRDDPQFTYTINYEKKSGQVIPGETSVFYLRNSDDEIVGFAGLIRDVSEREERMHQLQVMDRVFRHNVHNALNVVLGYADLLAMNSSDSIRTQAEKIRDATESLLETTDKQREIMSVLSDGRERLRYDSGTLVSQVVEQEQVRHLEATIDLDISSGASVHAIEDIDAAIGELLDNAIKHSDADAPHVEVRVETNADQVLIQVKDAGPGIPEMEKRVLLGDQDIEPLYHGSGLGLWFVNLIVRLSDGVLEVAENEPQGTIVTVQLPAAR